MEISVPNKELNQVSASQLNPIAQVSVVKKPRMRFSVKFSLLVLTSVTVLVSALSIHLPWLYISNENISEMAGQLSEEIIGGVNRELGDMFNAAYIDQRVITEVFSKQIVDLEDSKRRDDFFLAFLKANPYYSFVAVGLNNGNFYGAQRKADTNLVTIASIYDARTKRAIRLERTYVGAGNDFAFIRETSRDSDYYSPSRQWFQRAVARPHADVITDPYVFAKTGKLGINTATTLDINGKMVGVVNIAFEFNRLSAYMSTLKVGRTGTAFMVSPTSQLLAFREPMDDFPPPVDAKSGEPVPIRKIDSVPHPLLKVALGAMREKDIGFDKVTSLQQMSYKDSGGNVYVVTLSPSGNQGWVIGTVVPRSDFTAQIDANMKKIWAAVLGTILLASLGAIWVAHRLLVVPLRSIMHQTQRVESFNLEEVRPVKTVIIEIDQVSSAIGQMAKGLGSFGRYLPLDLVKTLLANGTEARIGGETRTMSILFMDLVGFTAISESMGPKLVPFLGRYLGGMSDVIEQRQGTVDKFIGDAVMAFWGAPKYIEDHAVLACRAALECLKELEVIRQEWPSAWRQDLSIRIGINTGRVIVGNIGSATRLNYTVLGDPVNLASRLEGTCKNYGVRCLIGESTHALTRYDVIARRLDKVKGAPRLSLFLNFWPCRMMRLFPAPMTGSRNLKQD